jgi:hypothetical protein
MRAHRGISQSDFWRLRNSSHVYSYAIALALTPFFREKGHLQSNSTGLILDARSTTFFIFGSVAYRKAAGARQSYLADVLSKGPDSLAEECRLCARVRKEEVYAARRDCRAMVGKQNRWAVSGSQMMIFQST